MIWTLALATLLVLPFTKLAALRWPIGLPVKAVQTVLPPVAARVAAIMDDQRNRGPLGRSARVIGGVAVVALVTGSSLLQAKDKPDADASKLRQKQMARLK